MKMCPKCFEVRCNYESFCPFDGTPLVDSELPESKEIKKKAMEKIRIREECERSLHEFYKE